MQLGVGSYALLTEQLINFNKLGHMPFKEDDGISLDLKQNGQSIMLGLSSKIHQTKVGMIKKQQ